MAARLKSLEKDLEFQLDDFNLIGRSPDATIRLLDGGVSRQHATIRRDGSLFWVSDLGSANGTFVNDVAVTTARALRHGDRVQIGTSLYAYENDAEAETGPASSSTTQALHTIALPARTVKATLLVGDLRNFTAISAQLSAEEVAAMLREWYAQCEQVLKSRGAVIDKFIGDGVFAYWHGDTDDIRAKATEAARIRAMYTDPAFTRRGVGRLILSLCETAARDAGFARVEMMATLAGEPLYAACGYRVIERVADMARGDVPVPGARMGKAL